MTSAYDREMARFRRKIIRLVIIAAVTLIITLGIHIFGFTLFRIPTSSMAPSLLIGDVVFVSKFSYGFGQVGTFGGFIPIVGRLGGNAPERGDVIVFKPPADDSIFYIKRLIGLPGDHIQMKRGTLYINNQPAYRQKLDQQIAYPGDDEESGDFIDYIELLPNNMAHIIRMDREQDDEWALGNTAEMIVPPHSYFFMGDNRDKSSDSRTSDVGFVPEENLVGRADFIVVSMEKDARFFEFSKWSWAMRWQRMMIRVM